MSFPAETQRRGEVFFELFFLSVFAPLRELGLVIALRRSYFTAARGGVIGGGGEG